MAFNTRQANFVAEVRDACADARDLYGRLYNLKESFAEEFATPQENDLSLMTDELAAWGLTYTNMVVACNQFMTYFVNFWDGNAVTTREYGKDARRVASNE